MGWKLDPGSDLIVNLHLQPTGSPNPWTLPWVFTSPISRRSDSDAGATGARWRAGYSAGAGVFVVTDHLKLPIAVDCCHLSTRHYLGKQIDAWAQFPTHAARAHQNNDWESTGRLHILIPIRCLAGGNHGGDADYLRQYGEQSTQSTRPPACAWRQSKHRRNDMSGCKCFRKPPAKTIPVTVAEAVMSRR